MLDAKEIGNLIGEEIKNEPAPGFYPGSFRPPTKGHFNVAYERCLCIYIVHCWVYFIYQFFFK